MVPACSSRRLRPYSKFRMWKIQGNVLLNKRCFAACVASTCVFVVVDAGLAMHMPPAVLTA